MIFDDVLKRINTFGKYQKILYLLIVIPNLFHAQYTLVSVFILGDHQHRCKLPSKYDNGTAGHNITMWASQCAIYRYNHTSNITNSEECSEWTYGTEIQSTPISDFDLVCEKEMLKSHASMLYFGGTLVGVALTAFTGDVFGRKPLFVFSIILACIAPLVCAFSPTYTVFAAMRFLTGIATITSFNSAFIICMEIVGPNQRVFVGIVVELLWCLGELILCGLAYFFTNWRTLMLTFTVPHFLFLTYIFFLPESPRWLISQGKTQEAKVILEKIARVNGTVLPDEEIEVPETKRNIGEVLRMFGFPKLACRLFIVIFIWFVITLSYYGLTQNVGKIGGNIFVNFLVSSIVEALGYSSCLVVNDRFGRKWMNCGGLWLAGLACLSTIFTSLYADESLNWITITLSMIGKFGVCGAFGNIFIYTTELFPTTMRSFVLSVSNFGARSGSVVSPYVANIGDAVDSMFGRALPLIIFGCLFIAAGSLSFALPETMNTLLPETIDDLINEKRICSAVIKDQETKEQKEDRPLLRKSVEPR